MGLTVWRGTKVRRADVTVAKNYLRQDEIGELNRIVSMYLDFAEDRAKRHQPMHMHDWRERLDAFLKFNERDILQNAGKVSMEVAQKLALEEYDKFSQRRLTEEAVQADAFDAAATRLLEKAPPGPSVKPRKPRKKGKGS